MLGEDIVRLKMQCTYLLNSTSSFKFCMCLLGRTPNLTLFNSIKSRETKPFLSKHLKQQLNCPLLNHKLFPSSNDVRVSYIKLLEFGWDKFSVPVIFIIGVQYCHIFLTAKARLSLRLKFFIQPRHRSKPSFVDEVVQTSLILRTPWIWSPSTSPKFQHLLVTDGSRALDDAHSWHCVALL